MALEPPTRLPRTGWQSRVACGTLAGMGTSCLALALLLAAAPAKPSRSPVRLTVSVRFLPERRGDGAPQLRFTFRFQNLGSAPLHLSWYGYPIETRHVAPRSLFSVIDAPIRPHKLRPPQRGDFFELPAGGTVEKVTEEWVGSFVVQSPDGKHQEYRLRRPGRVALSQCYAPDYVDAEDMKKLLPPGATPFLDTLCAPPVKVNIPALPSQRM
jgi:hypothetical protein